MKEWITGIYLLMWSEVIRYLVDKVGYIDMSGGWYCLYMIKQAAIFCSFICFLVVPFLGYKLLHLSLSILYIKWYLPTLTTTHESFIILFPQIYYTILALPQRSRSAFIFKNHSINLASFLRFQNTIPSNITINVRWLRLQVS